MCRAEMRPLGSFSLYFSGGAAAAGCLLEPVSARVRAVMKV